MHRLAAAPGSDRIHEHVNAAKSGECIRNQLAQGIRGRQIHAAGQQVVG